MDNSTTPQTIAVIQPTSPPINPKLKFLFMFAMMMLVGSFSILGFSLIKTKTPAPPANKVPQNEVPSVPRKLSAEITYLTGAVWKVVDGRKMELLQNDLLTQSDTIITSANSRAVFVFDDGSTVRIDENTEINLANLSPNYMELTNKKGVLYARVNKDQTHQFIIGAGNIKVASLGTSFVVENETDVKVQVFESKVQVTDSKQQTTEVSTNQQWLESEQKVKTLSSAEIKKDDFLAWNIKQDQPTNPSPDPTTSPSASPTTAPKLTLKGAAYAEGIIFEWTTTGDMNLSKGFKVVKNQSGSPKYPGDSYNYVSDPSARRLDWKFGDGSEWHFRVCQYLDNGQCGIYSNEVVIKTFGESKQDKQSQNVKNLNLTLNALGDRKVKVSWSIEGTSNQGFKVVWSKNTNPTYPTREGDAYHYLSDAGSREDTIENLETGNTYYVRVCEYLGGTCGVYSSQQSIKID